MRSWPRQSLPRLHCMTVVPGRRPGKGPSTLVGDHHAVAGGTGITPLGDPSPTIGLQSTELVLQFRSLHPEQLDVWDHDSSLPATSPWLQKLRGTTDTGSAAPAAPSCWFACHTGRTTKRPPPSSPFHMVRSPLYLMVARVRSGEALHVSDIGANAVLWLYISYFVFQDCSSRAQVRNQRAAISFGVGSRGDRLGPPASRQVRGRGALTYIESPSPEGHLDLVGPRSRPWCPGACGRGEETFVRDVPPIGGRPWIRQPRFPKARPTGMWKTS